MNRVKQTPDYLSTDFTLFLTDFTPINQKNEFQTPAGIFQICPSKFNDGRAKQYLRLNGEFFSSLFDTTNPNYYRFDNKKYGKFYLYIESGSAKITNRDTKGV